MTDFAPNPIPQRRWLAWRPNEAITADSAPTEPTKPSEPGFDGFDGSSPARLAEIGTMRSGRDRPKANESAVDLATRNERVMSWAEWKAGALNQLFLELGNTGQPGRITAHTIRHGEQAWMTNWKNRGVASQKSPRSE